MRNDMRLTLIAIGFTSAVGQIVLVRELVAALYGNELILGLALAIWLAWVALGAWGLERLSVFDAADERRLAAGLALAGAALPAQMAGIRGLRGLLGVAPGAWLELGPALGAMSLILAPLCLLVGALFTLSARLLTRSGGSGGQAYAWESLGAVAGGALFSFVLIHILDPFQTALLCTALDLAAAWGCLGAGKPGRRFVWKVEGSPTADGRPARPSLARPLGWALAFGLLAAGALGIGPRLQRATLGWQWGDFVFAADSPYARLVIQAKGQQRIFFQNGRLVFETQGAFPEEISHLPLLMHPGPRSVLLIGGGVAGDVREILKHPVERLTYVEPDPLLIKAALTHLPAQDAAALHDPRVKLTFSDGRQYVRQVGAAGQTFDVVILDVPEPATGALNRFYTREFFAQVQAVLKPGGVFALGLPASETYWSAELARRNGNVYHTLHSVFPYSLALSGEHNFFFASESPLESDPDVLAKRLEERGLPTRLVKAGYLAYLFNSDRFVQGQQALLASQAARLNQDMTPICYYYDLAVWLAHFGPSWPERLENARRVNIGWLAIPLIALAVLTRRRRAWAIPMSLICAGLAGMMLEVVSLLGFQVMYGSVYAQVSLIITAFMAGSAAGSGLGQGWPARSSRPARWGLPAALAGLAACAGAFLLAMSLPAGPGVAALLLLTLLAGGLVGAAFPLALELARQSDLSAGQGKPATGMLYSADLLGGCLGAAVGAAWCIPVLGIPQTCGLIAIIALAGLLATLRI